MTYCCIICHEVIKQSNAAALLCGHIFDAQCIRNWTNLRSTCPVCRRPSRSSDILLLYNESQEDQIEILLKKEREKLEEQYIDKISKLTKQVEQTNLEKQGLMLKLQNHLEKYLDSERKHSAIIYEHYELKEKYKAHIKQHLLTSRTLEQLQKQLQHRKSFSIKLIGQKSIELSFSICLKAISLISFKTTVSMCMNLSAGACLVLLIYEIFSITRVILAVVSLIAFYYLYKQHV